MNNSKMTSMNSSKLHHNAMEAPACVQNAMMTKDKKPFTYTPGGIDLSQIKSERMAKRLARNAQAEGISSSRADTDQQKNQSLNNTPVGNQNPSRGAISPGVPYQVLPPLPLGKKTNAVDTAPPPPPPPTFLPMKKSAHDTCKSAAPQKFEPPPLGFRPEIKIPVNPMANLRKVPPPVEKNNFWKDEYIKDRSEEYNESVPNITNNDQHKKNVEAWDNQKSFPQQETACAMQTASKNPVELPTSPHPTSQNVQPKFRSVAPPESPTRSVYVRSESNNTTEEPGAITSIKNSGDDLFKNSYEKTQPISDQRCQPSPTISSSTQQPYSQTSFKSVAPQGDKYECQTVPWRTQKSNRIASMNAPLSQQEANKHANNTQEQQHPQYVSHIDFVHQPKTESGPELERPESISHLSSSHTNKPHYVVHKDLPTGLHQPTQLSSIPRNQHHYRTMPDSSLTSDKPFQPKDAKLNNNHPIVLLNSVTKQEDSRPTNMVPEHVSVQTNFNSKPLRSNVVKIATSSYGIPVPNQFVDQGYNSYPVSLEQTQQYRSVSHQSSIPRTHIIPIVIEADGYDQKSHESSSHRAGNMNDTTTGSLQSRPVNTIQNITDNSLEGRMSGIGMSTYKRNTNQNSAKTTEQVLLQRTERPINPSESSTIHHHLKNNNMESAFAGFNTRVNNQSKEMRQHQDIGNRGLLFQKNGANTHFMTTSSPFYDDNAPTHNIPENAGPGQSDL